MEASFLRKGKVLERNSFIKDYVNKKSVIKRRLQAKEKTKKQKKRTKFESEKKKKRAMNEKHSSALVFSTFGGKLRQNSTPNQCGRSAENGVEATTYQNKTRTANVIDL
ncbi:hypothetical protein V1477_021324 [Vespula maculifrons]|uniref:Uncharacterized protein n=1 Tax=Vespula maculifrons TaxID=7453 RepID=A0ABD2AJ24_VESMC